MDPRPRQFLVKLAYAGKPFSTITVELSPPEGRAAIEYDEVQTPSLAGIGLDDRPVIACLTVKYQIAQKLHACTHQRDDGVANDRARDLVDILLLEPLLDELPVGDVKAACVDTFTGAGGPRVAPAAAGPAGMGVHLRGGLRWGWRVESRRTLSQLRSSFGPSSCALTSPDGGTRGESV